LTLLSWDRPRWAGIELTQGHIGWLEADSHAASIHFSFQIFSRFLHCFHYTFSAIFKAISWLIAAFQLTFSLRLLFFSPFSELMPAFASWLAAFSFHELTAIISLPPPFILMTFSRYFVFSDTLSPLIIHYFSLFSFSFHYWLHIDYFSLLIISLILRH